MRMRVVPAPSNSGSERGDREGPRLCFHRPLGPTPVLTSMHSYRSDTVRDKSHEMVSLQKTPGGRVPPGTTEYRFYSVRNRKCHVASTRACTMADAKIDPVFRHVHP